MICNKEDTDGRARVTADKERLGIRLKINQQKLKHFTSKIAQECNFLAVGGSVITRRPTL